MAFHSEFEISEIQIYYIRDITIRNTFYFAILHILDVSEVASINAYNCYFICFYNILGKSYLYIFLKMLR